MLPKYVSDQQLQMSMTEISTVQLWSVKYIYDRAGLGCESSVFDENNFIDDGGGGGWFYIYMINLSVKHDIDINYSYYNSHR